MLSSGRGQSIFEDLYAKARDLKTCPRGQERNRGLHLCSLSQVFGASAPNHVRSDSKNAGAQRHAKTYNMFKFQVSNFGGFVSPAFSSSQFEGNRYFCKTQSYAMQTK